MHSYTRIYLSTLNYEIPGQYAEIKTREKYQDTPESSSIYQNAPGSSKFTKLPLYQKKYAL